MTAGLVLLLGAPVFWLAAWLPPRRAQPVAMLGVTIAVMAFAAPLSVVVALGLGAAVHLLARDAERRPGRIIGIVALCAAAFVALKHDVRLGESGGALGIRLGFAYYSLRLLHYSLDRYAGRQRALKPLELLSYTLFFPTLVAGPIHRVGRFQRELRRRRWDSALATQGGERVLYGLVRIVVLGNFLVGQAREWLARVEPPAWQQGLGELGCYGANLYCQFAGFSDLAIGVALLAGVRIEENFNRPFLATNISDFWRRWHMTLSGWCRDYVFTPMTAVTRRASVGVVASMIALGAWHEPSLRYLAWGVYHGLGIAVWRLLQRRLGPRKARGRALNTGMAIGGWALTMAFVILSFALTSTAGITEALSLWACIFSLEH